MKEIAAAFVKAQQEFAPALKSSINPHFKSRYVDLAGCVEAVIDALNNNGLGLMQRTYEDDSGVTVETVLIHSSGKMLECGKLHVPASKQDAQGYGSALTYARRYSLMAACGLAPEDDDGNAASKSAPKIQPKTAEKKIPESEFADHMAAMEASGDVDSLKASFGKAWNASAGDSMARSNIKASYDALMAKLTGAK